MTRYNIDTCAMLVELSISQWTARKLDKSTTDEVIANKQAGDKGAARVNKHLLAGRTELEVINQHVVLTRHYVYTNTLPWSDSGIRLLPTAKFMEFTTTLRDMEDKFFELVNDFVTVYPTLITAQAMALGNMFNRADYPSADDIARRFKFNTNYMPVPTAGDFRIDVGNDAHKELQEKLTKLADERIDNAMGDIKARLKEHLTRMSDRLGSDIVAGQIKPRMFHDSLLQTAHELCSLSRDLNLTNDYDLEQARLALQNAIRGIDVKDLRRDMPTRNDTKAQVDAILSKFSI
jgi:hypothetical protein